jgi:aryl-alcohol dehydrogenase-like predicted oxidoreductase
LLDYAFERGINLLDTAEAYGEKHASEKIVGRWLRQTGLRDQVVLQTKIARNFTRTHLLEALDGSLERLGTDRVDIYLFHGYDPQTALEEALEAMTAAVEAGKVRMAGCSNFNLEQLRNSRRITEERKLARLEAIQPVYNLVRREIEAGILPFCHAKGISAVTYSPLGAGFLAGKYAPGADFPKGTRFDIVPGHADEYFSERNFAIVDRLRGLALQTGEPMVRLAMAWVLHRPMIDGVLMGARHEGQIDNAIEALLNPLPPGLAAELDAWSAPPIAG